MISEQNLSEIKKLLATNQAILLYFYNDDCLPCLSLRPKVEKLVSTTFPEIKVIWINAKANPGIPAFFDIFSNPAIVIFFEGKESKRFSKYISVNEMEQAIDRYYKLIF